MSFWTLVMITIYIIYIKNDSNLSKVIFGRKISNWIKKCHNNMRKRFFQDRKLKKKYLNRVIKFTICSLINQVMFNSKHKK